MPNLSSLPGELLCKTSGFVHPQTVIDWACTCKLLSRCSLQALTTHKQRRSELRVVHDRNPITIPSLMRSSLSEPEILWYLRSLDIWDLKEKFEEWKSPRFSGGNPVEDWDSEEYLDWPEKHHDYSHLDTTFYADEELERYRSIFSKLLHLTESLIDKWMQRLRSGSDEPQKVLLMAMSPRLNKVTFVEYDSWQGEVRSHPFRMLASTLRALAPLPSPQWPCFQNLKTVFVGGFSELRHPHDGYYPHSRVISPLFLLPAIEELHLNLLMGEQSDPDSDLESDEDPEDPEPYVWEWEKGRSSCQELTFSCCDIATETIASFISATHSLRSLRGVTNEDVIMSALLEHSKHSLETVKFDQGPLPTSGAVPQHPFQDFQKLTKFVVSTSQLVDISTYKPSQIKYTVDSGIDVEKSAFGTTDWVDLLSFLPPTLQRLKIRPCHVIHLFGHEVQGLINRLVALVDYKQSSPNGAFASLIEICLAKLSVKSKGRFGGYEQDGLDPWLGDLKRVCKEAKVKIHANGRTTSIEGPFGDSLPCSSCRSGGGIDSTPVIPEDED